MFTEHQLGKHITAVVQLGVTWLICMQCIFCRCCSCHLYLCCCTRSAALTLQTKQSAQALQVLLPLKRFGCSHAYGAASSGEEHSGRCFLPLLCIGFVRVAANSQNLCPTSSHHVNKKSLWACRSCVAKPHHGCSSMSVTSPCAAPDGHHTLLRYSR